nr:MAG TPA: major capsid protein [Microviridae sp.]
MNRNSEYNFAQNPQVGVSRSRFQRNSDNKTTFNTGDLIPIYLDEVLPGDTHEIDMACVMRMATPIFPVMDNAFCDFYFFFVPNRLLWEHWKEFMGENKETAWTPKTEYSIPQVTAPAEGWAEGTLADYLGLPTKVKGISVSALPGRAYGLIYNEWFRNQNVTQPTLVEVTDATTTGKNDGSKTNDSAITLAKPLKAAKVFDYYTGALPEPQKGEPITIPLTGNAPIKAYLEKEMQTPATGIKKPDGSIYGPWRWGDGITDLNQSDFYDSKMYGIISKPGYEYSDTTGNKTSDNAYLGADLGAVTAATINQLRQAFQIQKLLEKDARGGTRYREVLREHFGVISPDSRMQIPEYLGGYRLPINVSQVIQTSSTDNTSPLGNTAALSVTTMNKPMFTKSFTEHGFIMGLAVVRTDQTYQQGIERMWSRTGRYDYYWPVLANIGEQAILNKEIFAQGNAKDDEAFGYQEAWADYRYKPSKVTGLFRSNAQQSLDAWHYAQDYDALPTLSTDWMEQGEAEMKRTLAVQSQPDFIADFYFMNKTTRCMPVYSIPGLIDHH